MELNAQIIRNMRMAKGWTQQELADICSLSLRTIQRVEVKGLGSLETSKSLAAAFEVDRDTLLGSAAQTSATSDNSVKRSVIWFLLSFVFGSLFGALGLWLVLNYLA